MRYLSSIHSFILTTVMAVLFGAPAASQTDASDWACEIRDSATHSAIRGMRRVIHRMYAVDEQIASAVSREEALELLTSLTTRIPDQFTNSGVKAYNEATDQFKVIPYDQLAISLTGGFPETSVSRQLNPSRVFGFMASALVKIEKSASKGSACFTSQFYNFGKGRKAAIEALNKASGVATALLALGARQVKPETMIQRMNLSRSAMVDPVLRTHPNLRSILEANRIGGWSPYVPGLLPGLGTLEETEAYDTTKVR